jgi:hypothetical protein
MAVRSVIYEYQELSVTPTEIACGIKYRRSSAALPKHNPQNNKNQNGAETSATKFPCSNS